MDLKEYYLQNIREEDYHYRFYDSIKSQTEQKFEVYDAEEAIKKFRELCQPENYFNDIESKCWFYLVTYFLYTKGYKIKEFPRILARPPIEPNEFNYGDIRNKIIQNGDDKDGTVAYATRRVFVDNLTFDLNSSPIDIDDALKQKFLEISNRQATFNNMSIDEKLAEIANLIENLLKKNGKFIQVDYSSICDSFISDNDVTAYRKKMHCFRHATDDAINERKSYSEDQKEFFLNYGLTILNVIWCLLK